MWTLAEFTTARPYQAYAMPVPTVPWMEKLNLHRKADLIRYAIRTGLVDAEE
jgi:hypothetical protein